MISYLLSLGKTIEELKLGQGVKCSILIWFDIHVVMVDIVRSFCWLLDYYVGPIYLALYHAF